MLVEQNQKKKMHHMPKAVYFIIPNEFCERFAFYGIKPLLFFYFAEFLGTGKLQAKQLSHLFSMFTYLCPLIGGALSDSYLGKYKTIVLLSFVYFIGLGLLTTVSIPGVVGNPPSLSASLVALLLIALGTGGIKPCVSAHGGDQFCALQQRSITLFFSIFYATINLGALVSGYVTPALVRGVDCFGGPCYALGFGVPTFLFLISIVIFIIGKQYYRVVEPSGSFMPFVFCKVAVAALRNRRINKNSESLQFLDYAVPEYSQVFVDDMRQFFHVAFIVIPASFFWMLYDQIYTEWQIQYAKMSPTFFGLFDIPAEAYGNVNMVLVIVLSFLFSRFMYPLIEKRIKFGLLERMVWGMSLCVIAFVMSAALNYTVDAYFSNCASLLDESKDSFDTHSCLNGNWQFPQYFILTAGEVLFSISGLEFAYTQVAKEFRSISSSIWLLGLAFGNLFVVVFESLISYRAENGSMVQSIDASSKLLVYSAIALLFTIVLKLWARRYLIKGDI